MKELDIINYGNCISTSRPDSITTGTVWIGRSNDKNGVYPTTQLLNGVARVSIKNVETREINYGNCISASRPDRIIPGTLWIRRSNVKNGVYPTTYLFNRVALVFIENEEIRDINYGNCISASRPDRSIPGTL
jgi:hypothetical protein